MGAERWLCARTSDVADEQACHDDRCPVQPAQTRILVLLFPLGLGVKTAGFVGDGRGLLRQNQSVSWRVDWHGFCYGSPTRLVGGYRCALRQYHA